MKLKVSIITINYNNLKGLKKTVNSVLNQTWKDFEFLVIDGASKDGSAEYLNCIKDKLDYYIREKDTGIYNAMNKGITNAKGEYLLFLNSGDHFFCDTVLENNHRFLNGKDVIYFNLHVIENDKSFVKSYPKTLSFSYFVEDTLPHPATFIKRDAFTKTNFYNEEFKILSDWKFFIDAICKYNLSYTKIDETLSTFYIGGMSSIPENRVVKFNEREKVLKDDYPLYLQDIDDVLINKNIVTNLRNSRIIKILVKFGFLNRF